MKNHQKRGINNVTNSHSCRTKYGDLKFGYGFEDQNLNNNDQQTWIAFELIHGDDGLYETNFDNSQCTRLTEKQGMNVTCPELYKIYEAANIGARGFDFTITQSDDKRVIWLNAKWEIMKITTKLFSVALSGEHSHDLKKFDVSDNGFEDFTDMT